MTGPPPSAAVPPGGPPAAPGAPEPSGTARLSPRVLLIDPIRMLPSLVLPLAGVLLAGGFSPASFGWAAAGVAGSVIYAVLRWATFTYRVAGGRLELTRALVGRSVRTIPLERIRGVDVSASPLHRVLGLAVLRLDTGAGGGEQEGVLDALTAERAEALRAVLLARGPLPAVPGPAGAGTPQDAGPAERGPGPAAQVVRGAAVAAAGAVPAEGEGGGADDPPRVLARVPRAWLMYGPLSGAYLFTPFALVAGAFGLAWQWRRELGLGERAAVRALEWALDRPGLLIAVALVLVAAMPVAGGVTYALFNWDFTLRSREGHLVAERGLFTRRSVSLERRRIRGYELADGLIERRAGVVRLWALVTGLGDARSRGQLLPVTPRAFATGVAAEAVGPIRAPLRRHPPAARRRRLVRAVAPWLLAAVAALLAGWNLAAIVASVLAVAGVPLAFDRYRSLGHAYDGARLSVRSGSLRRGQVVVERRAVVGWTVRQTLPQRMAGLLTVVAGVGAGSGGYAVVDAGEEQGVAFAAEVTPEWLAPFLASRPPAG
ncbi:PH domain-containing protein [Microbispora sp. H10836]|uniref:PH domain-containing protein n=1 Tax=Microbispora sp. H10836 TaxID=2729106 RepID=UPI00289326A4|nr:PH domain-containing protein [Microbispora sp. H10836]